MQTVKFSLKASVPMLFGYVSVGFTFGLLCVASGYEWYVALISSVVLYAGSVQFVGVDLFSRGAGAIETFLLALLMNLRYTAYGIALLDRYKDAKHRTYLNYALSDETFALIDTTEIREGIDRNKFYLYVTIFDQVYWLAGTMAGVFAAKLITFNTKGMDFTLTALFLVSFLSQWEDSPKGLRQHLPALIGLFSGVVMVLIFGAANMMAPALGLLAMLLFALRGKIEEKPLVEGAAE